MNFSRPNDIYSGPIRPILTSQLETVWPYLKRVITILRLPRNLSDYKWRSFVKYSLLAPRLNFVFFLLVLNQVYKRVSHSASQNLTNLINSHAPSRKHTYTQGTPLGQQKKRKHLRHQPPNPLDRNSQNSCLSTNTTFELIYSSQAKK